MQKKKIGDHNGYLEIIREDHTEKRIHYTFLCHKCGKTFTGLSYYLDKYADGCPECRLKEKYEKKLDGLFDKKYGKLTPMNYHTHALQMFTGHFLLYGYGICTE